MSARPWLALLAAALLTAACKTSLLSGGGDDAALDPAAAPPVEQIPAAAGTTAPDADAASPSDPAPVPKPDPAFLPRPPKAGEVPHIYLALQDEGPGKPVSAVFAIDAARNGTPSDDPAIRLTPDGGRCNPQEMTSYSFAPGTAPTVGDVEARDGLTARDLPAYMAVAVTNEMLTRNIATEPEQTRPLNICTRKLWEQLVVIQTTAAGQ
jgi:hypothetical protein